MESIQKAIKCSACNKVLETPVFLPCSHSICKKHVIEKNRGDKLRCAKCGFDHEIPANGFPVIEALCEIIEAKIGTIDLGSTYKEATESCAKFNGYVEEMENLVNNPTSYTYDEISQLKSRVHLKSEQLKLKIDKETEKLLNKLKEYQTRCDDSLTTDSYLNGKRKRYNELNKETYSASLASWKSELNELKFDERKWKKITKECKKSIEVLEEGIKAFKKDLLLGYFTDYSKDVNFFEQISIDDLFIHNEPVASKLANNVSSKIQIGFNSYGQLSSPQMPTKELRPSSLNQHFKPLQIHPITSCNQSYNNSNTSTNRYINNEYYIYNNPRMTPESHFSTSSGS